MRQFLKALVLLPMVIFRLVNILARKASWAAACWLQEDLLQAGLATEAQRFNIPHVRSSGDDAVAVANTALGRCCVDRARCYAEQEVLHLRFAPNVGDHQALPRRLGPARDTVLSWSRRALL